MGNWNITIRGVGCHHNNNNPKDANIMTASFTHGGEDDLTNVAPEEPPKG